MTETETLPAMEVVPITWGPHPGKQPGATVRRGPKKDYGACLVVRMTEDGRLRNVMVYLDGEGRPRQIVAFRTVGYEPMTEEYARQPDLDAAAQRFLAGDPTDPRREADLAARLDRFLSDCFVTHAGLWPSGFTDLVTAAIAYPL